jgi:hypothetical protein
MKKKKSIIIKEPDYMGENRKGFQKLCSFFVVLAGLLALSLSFDAWAIGSGVTLGGVAGVGQSIVGETPTSSNVDAASPTLMRQAVLKKIVQTHPSSFPLDTLLSYMTQQDTPSWEYRAYDTPYLPYRGTLAAATSATTTAGDPVVISPSNIEHIRSQSCLFFRTISGAATTDGKWLALHVQLVSRGSKTIEAIPLNATAGKVGVIASGTEFIIGPIAAHELDMTVESQVPVPQSYSNFNQLFMCQMEVGDYEEAHLKEVGWGWSDIQDYTIMDFRARRTISYYFGFATKFIDTLRNVEKYSTGGIERQITRRFTSPAGAWADGDFIEFSRYVFVGVKGSQKKIVLAGDQLIANMSKAPVIQKQQQATSTEVVFGLTFSKIKTNFGELLIHYDPLLTEMGLPTKGVVLDPEFLVRTNFNGVQHEKLDPKGSGFKRAKIESIAEASSALLRNRDSHVWID